MAGYIVGLSLLSLNVVSHQPSDSALTIHGSGGAMVACDRGRPGNTGTERQDAGSIPAQGPSRLIWSA